MRFRWDDHVPPARRASDGEAAAGATTLLRRLRTIGPQDGGERPDRHAPTRRAA
ncbi:MAG TPA: hypothetical protein VFA66_04170 [Gaiellaceae bacterium]|nr:hypothetical protein [Gaiellaceae bacterium]